MYILQREILKLFDSKFEFFVRNEIECCKLMKSN